LMLVSTMDHVPGKKVVRVLGLVRGNTIRARHLGQDIMAGLRTLVGGEVKEYTKMLAEAREEALDRMLAAARQLGANAVLEVRLASAQVIGGAAEIVAYGTAVVLEDDPTATG